MYKYIVYKTTNKINNYIYIGVHRTDIDKYDFYIGCGLYAFDTYKKQFKHRKFHNAVKKYGVKNFVRETLYEFPDSEEGKIAAYKKEAELVNREFIKRKDVYNTCLGGKVPSSVNEKAIAQYTIEGKFLKAYNSITEASVLLNFSNSALQSACCKAGKVSHGFQWRYFTGDKSDIPATEPPVKPIYQFDLQGNYITYYKSAAEAAKKTGICGSSILNNCNGKIRASHGYFWSYKKHFDYVPAEKRGTAVACYDDSGTFIKEYASVREAAEIFNVHEVSIYKVISGYKKHCKNLRWRYFYGNKQNISSLNKKD